MSPADSSLRPPPSQSSSSVASTKTKKSKRPSTSSRPSARFAKTEIIINVYDLLPPGAISSCLWPLGLSLLHTGIVLGDKEYSYGATSSLEDGSHSGDPRSGVFWTHPQLEPPGATFRCSLLLGFTYLSKQDLEALVEEQSSNFLGKDYNLLTKNCNHFTNHMCKLLVKKEAPGWINRAAVVGKVLPCLVPRDWINTPEADDVQEAWLEADDDEDAEEGSSMLRSYRAEPMGSQRASNSQHGSTGRTQDTEGRRLPASEQAPSGRLI